MINIQNFDDLIKEKHKYINNNPITPQHPFKYITSVSFLRLMKGVISLSHEVKQQGHRRLQCLILTD